MGSLIDEVEKFILENFSDRAFCMNDLRGKIDRKDHNISRALASLEKYKIIEVVHVCSVTRRKYYSIGGKKSMPEICWCWR